MSVLEKRHGAVTVLKPDGPLTGDEAEGFRSRFRQVLADSMGRCVVDASAVSYVDSKGLEALVEANDAMLQGGNALRLCGVAETVREVLLLTNLSSRFDYFEDVTSAVRSFL